MSVFGEILKMTTVSASGVTTHHSMSFAGDILLLTRVPLAGAFIFLNCVQEACFPSITCPRRVRLSSWTLYRKSFYLHANSFGARHKDCLNHKFCTHGPNSGRSCRRCRLSSSYGGFEKPTPFPRSCSDNLTDNSFSMGGLPQPSPPWEPAMLVLSFCHVKAKFIDLLSRW